MPPRPQKWTARYNREESQDLGLWQQCALNYRHGRWMYEFDVNPRLQYRATRLDTLITRGFIGYRSKPWLAVWFGFYPWAPVFEPVYVSESRTLQQFAVEKSFGRVGVSMRNRLEQRFIEHTDGTSWRLRLMPRIDYFINEKRSLYVFTANEMFFNLNATSPAIREGYNQNRFFSGFGFRINKHANLEVSYLNQFLRRRNAFSTLPNRVNHNIALNLITNF